MDLRNFLASTQQNPRSILKVVVSLSVVLLVIWLFLVSRMELNETVSTDPQSVERTDNLRESLNNGRASRVQETDQESSPGIFMNAFTTFIVLGIILILVLFFMKKGNGQIKNRQLNEIEGYVLGQGAQIKVIEMNEEIWVIGITSSQINLLHRYSKDQWKDKMETPSEHGNDNNFYNLFKKKL